jgi:hypothetical protein
MDTYEHIAKLLQEMREIFKNDNDEAEKKQQAQQQVRRKEMIDFLIYFGMYALAISIVFVIFSILADLFHWD